MLGGGELFVLQLREDTLFMLCGVASPGSVDAIGDGRETRAQELRHRHRPEERSQQKRIDRIGYVYA
jgi:hypothetical protein